MTDEDDDGRAGPSPQRKIIDVDAFYASIEQRDTPDLRGASISLNSSAAI